MSHPYIDAARYEEQHTEYYLSSAALMEALGDMTAAAEYLRQAEYHDARARELRAMYRAL